LRLRDFGLSGADIAVVLGVSPQRVSQLMRTTGC
jgi:predicted transcriptional regulator